MDNQLLSDTGFDYDINDFYVKPIVLRDGRDSVLWVHEPTGHGILDQQDWENIDEDYFEKASFGTHVFFRFFKRSRRS